MTQSEKSIIVCGSGLAALMTAIALANGLNEAYRVVLAPVSDGDTQDAFYGSVTAPSGYEFCRALGLDEPTLFLGSGTSFSFGTRYKSWPSTKQDWTQAHHQPLPVLSGVPLQHHLVRNAVSLEPLLISAVAAQNNKFAHPPEDPAVPLSRAEYAYQFSAHEWSKLLQEIVDASRVEILTGFVEELRSADGEIKGLRMSSGDTLNADLYVDCSGPKRLGLDALSETFDVSRSLAFSVSEDPAVQLGPPCRVVEATPSGWVSKTFLQDHVRTLNVEIAPATAASDKGNVCRLGRVRSSWVGNCVAIGHAASVLEPLTPAPMILLQRDIERLLDLIPVSADMSVERREFNRRFDNDVTHATLFGNALFGVESLPETEYWKTAATGAKSPMLQRKIDQFENRGLLVKYDLEPFNDDDWTILHNGLGRCPARYDLQAERASKSEIEEQLQGMKQTIEHLVGRMPPHHLYVANMRRYLEKKQYG